ncbi:MAG: hypothetical protein ACD_79C01302G0012 [uncultured bacterium]|nr:MAG: hypothetical protein ACD_79C01302G0012 [uncultured bacterium]
MLNNKTILAVIPARRGSKRLQNKNKLLFCKKPLIEWTILEAKKSNYLDDIILSSDDDDIIKFCQKYGIKVPFKRPENLCKDNSKTIDVILHALENIKEKYDYIMLLQPTSPLRTAKDIDRCIELLFERKILSVVSISEINIQPNWIYRMTNNGIIKQLTKSNIEAKRYLLNGAIYLTKISHLRKNKSFFSQQTLGYKMPPERSIDIDNHFEFKIAEYLKSKKQ